MPEQKTKLLKCEFAELLGCLPIVVSRLVKNGEVKVGVDGRIDISTPEMKEYIKNKRIEIQKHKERITKKDLKLPKDKLTIDKGQLTINKSNNEKIVNSQLSIVNSNETSFHLVEYETKLHKLESEKHKAELLEMEVKQRKKDLIDTELLNRIITKTIGNLTKNIIEIPLNIVDELIDIIKTEEEPKPIIINLITKSLHKEIEASISKTEKEFLNYERKY